MYSNEAEHKSYLDSKFYADETLEAWVGDDTRPWHIYEKTSKFIANWEGP